MTTRSHSVPLRKVAIVGAESTGKTTLARQLAAHYQTSWNPEFVREFAMLKQQINASDLTAADLDTIFWGQWATEEQAYRRASPPFVFLDTNLLMSLVYADYYQNTQKAWWERVFAGRSYLYLLAEADFDWQPDPLRESPRVQSRLQQRIRSELQRRSIPFCSLRGEVQERVAQAIEWLEGHGELC